MLSLVFANWNGKWLQILGFYWRIWNKFVWNCPRKVISFIVTYRIIPLDQVWLHYLFSSKFASKRWNLAPNFTIYHCAYYKGAKCLHLWSRIGSIFKSEVTQIPLWYEKGWAYGVLYSRLIFSLVLFSNHNNSFLLRSGFLPIPF